MIFQPSLFSFFLTFLLGQVNVPSVELEAVEPIKMTELAIQEEFKSFTQPQPSSEFLAQIQAQLMEGGLFLGVAAPCAILYTEKYVYQWFWKMRHLDIDVKVCSIFLLSFPF